MIVSLRLCSCAPLWVVRVGLAATILLTSGMVALGLRTSLQQLCRLGMASLLLGCVSWVTMVALALGILLALIS